MLGATPLTGTPRECVLWDWLRRAFVRCVAIDLGRPDGIHAAPDALQPEPLAANARRRHYATKYRPPKPVKPNPGKLPRGAHVEQLAALIAALGPQCVPDLVAMTGASRQATQQLLMSHPERFRRTGKGKSVRWQLA